MSDGSVVRAGLPGWFSVARPVTLAGALALLREADAAPYSRCHVVTMPHLEVESEMTNTNRRMPAPSEASR